MELYDLKSDFFPKKIVHSFPRSFGLIIFWTLSIENKNEILKILIGKILKNSRLYSDNQNLVFSESQMTPIFLKPSQMLKTFETVLVFETFNFSQGQS